MVAVRRPSYHALSSKQDASNQEPGFWRVETAMVQRSLETHKVATGNGPCPRGSITILIARLLAREPISSHNDVRHCVPKDPYRCSMHGTTFLPATICRVIFKR